MIPRDFCRASDAFDFWFIWNKNGRRRTGLLTRAATRDRSEPRRPDSEQSPVSVSRGPRHVHASLRDAQHLFNVLSPFRHFCRLVCCLFQLLFVTFFVTFSAFLSHCLLPFSTPSCHLFHHPFSIFVAFFNIFLAFLSPFQHFCRLVCCLLQRLLVTVVITFLAFLSPF